MVGISYFYVKELLETVKQYHDDNPDEPYVELGTDINEFDKD